MLHIRLGRSSVFSFLSRRAVWPPEIFVTSSRKKRSFLMRRYLVGGFNPSEKYARQIGASSPNRGENSKNI